MTPRELRRAARLLRNWAVIRRNSYAWTDGTWCGDPDVGYTAKRAQKEHDELLDLARKLDAHARTVPAK